MTINFDDFLAEANSLSKKKEFKIFKGDDISIDSHIPYGVPTRIPQLDLAISRNGYPAGRLVEISGFEHCIDKDTFIHFQVRNKEDKVQNCKGGTIENLYNRFHFNKDIRTINSEYYVPCMMDEGFILNRKIKDVVNSGIQECYKLITKNNLSIICTLEHKFFSNGNFKRLKELNIGDTLQVSIGERQKGIKKQSWRPDVCVKFHPTSCTKVIEGKYVYKRLMVSRAAYEAYQNNLTYEDYIKRLNSGNLEGLKFLTSNLHIHHIDENWKNNSPENLIAITQSQHTSHHAKENLKNLSFIVSTDTIESIEFVGLRQTYDIIMSDPYRNYIANKFVVHNSGKSCVALAAIASAQRMGGVGAWIDAERTFDPQWAALNGCDPSKILLYEADTIEGLFDSQANSIEAYKRLNSTAPLVTVTDSVTAVSTKEDYEKDYDDVSRLGTDARAIRKCVKKINPLIAENKVTALYITHSIAKTAIGPYAKQSQSSGGHALKFFSTVRIELTKMSTIKEVEENKAGTEIQGRKGIEVGIAIEKHKAGKIKNLKLKCFLHENGFDLYENLFEALIHIGAIVKESRCYNIKFKNATIKRDDWKEFVINNCDGIDAMYSWFLKVAEEKGYIKNY